MSVYFYVVQELKSSCIIGCIRYSNVCLTTMPTIRIELKLKRASIISL